LAARIRTSPEPGGGAWAQQALWDPEPWVRRQGADALAQRLPEPAARDALRTFVGRADVDAYTRCGAALRLARNGDRETLPDVQAALSRAAEGWEAAPCALAASEMGDPEAGARLDAALREGELPLELAFVAALGASALPDVVASVGVAVDLVEEPLRIPLAAAWMELGAPAGASVLRDALGSDRLDQRLTVIDFLIGSDAAPAGELLRKAASADDSPSRRYAQLVMASHDGALGPVEAAAVDEDRDARMLAMTLTGELLVRAPDLATRAGNRARALLAAGLDDPDDAVRIAAAEALGRVGTLSETDELENTLAAEGAALRLAGACALMDIHARAAASPR
jgi:hypothetical protein